MLLRYCHYHQDDDDTVRPVDEIELGDGPTVTVMACQACRDRYGLQPIDRDDEPPTQT